MITLGLKNVNLLSKEQYDEIAAPAEDELYAISGSGFGFPSERYIDLTLGASGSTYTAPANGWFCLAKRATGTGQFIFMGGNGSKLQVQNWASAEGYIQSIFPVLKGTTITINYTTAGSTALFRFVYAEGEE